MTNMRIIVLSTFMLLAFTLGEINVQQQRIRRGAQDNVEGDARQLQLVRNTLQGSSTYPEKFLRTSSRRSGNGLGRNYLKMKQNKANTSRQNLAKFGKGAKIDVIKNMMPPHEDREFDQTTDSSVVSLAPSAAPSASPSVTDVEEAELSDSDGFDNYVNATSGRLGDNETETNNRDRLGSPTRADPDERDDLGDRDSNGGIDSANVTTGRIDNGSKDDLKIGAPTRETDRSEFASNSSNSSDAEIGSAIETTGRLIDENKDDNRIGFPTRATNRDDLSPNIPNSTSLPDVESTNDVTGRVAGGNKDTRRIGNPDRFTDRSEWVPDVTDSAFFNV